MTTMKTIEQLKSLLDDRMSFLGEQGNDYCRDIAALTAAIKAVNKPASGDKLYTAFDVIRIVQRVVSDELCELDEFDAPEAYYKIERGIIAELVKEDGCETNV
nr:MAG TPA: hypothetical protein [Caudoviricetes sp.]